MPETLMERTASQAGFVPASRHSWTVIDEEAAREGRAIARLESYTGRKAHLRHDPVKALQTTTPALHRLQYQGDHCRDDA